MKVPSLFTPIFHSVLSQHGLIVAAVYGLIWRYTQMNGNVCSVSMTRIGDLLGLDRRTILRSIIILKSGPKPFIKDTTPALFNRPHRYIITDQIHCDSESQPLDVTVTQSHSHCDSESHSTATQSHSNIDLKDSKYINTLYIWDNLVIHLLTGLQPGNVLSRKLSTFRPVSLISNVFTVEVPRPDHDWVLSRLTSSINSYLVSLIPPATINFVPYDLPILSPSLNHYDS